MNQVQEQSVSLAGLVHLCAVALEADPEGVFQAELDELVLDTVHQEASDRNNGDTTSHHDEDRHNTAAARASRLINAGYSEELSYLVEQGGFTPAELTERLKLAH